MGDRVRPRHPPRRARRADGRGCSRGAVADAGLAAPAPRTAGSPFDRFRGRIVFPIRDARGRAIALGGRAMDPAARPKYLNSPQTALFDKGRSLYNHGPRARRPRARPAPLIVAEGYMDVIALVRGGLRRRRRPDSAPRSPRTSCGCSGGIAAEPVVALDGDAAGRRRRPRGSSTWRCRWSALTARCASR